VYALESAFEIGLTTCLLVTIYNPPDPSDCDCVSSSAIHIKALSASHTVDKVVCTSVKETGVADSALWYDCI